MADTEGNRRKEWEQSRLGKFTASRMSPLLGEDGVGSKGALSVIYDRVGEELTGISADIDIDTDATRWGLKHETMAIDIFGQLKKLQFVVTQQLITPPGGRFGATPDFLIPIRESSDKTEWQVETGEVKCFPTYKAYIPMALCQTPLDVKRVDRKVFDQVICQMVECDALKGWLICYNPLFKAGNFNIVEFDREWPILVKGGKVYPVNEEFKRVVRLRAEIEQKFNEIRDKMIAKGHV